MNRPPFIVFEGIDGSGKSTQVRLLGEWLSQQGHAVHSTLEPTNYRIGSMLRRILTGKEQADEYTIAALFVADRLDHIHNPEYGMLARLAAGEIVITDRYYYSSYAYHSQFMPMDWVIQANSLAAKALRPDIVIFLDLTAEQSMARIRANRAEIEHYEKLENLLVVRKNYMEAIEKEGQKDKVIIIDAFRTVEEVAQDIQKAVFPLLNPDS